jgi:all-trans-nonaprenyl-diphosphate synthase
MLIADDTTLMHSAIAADLKRVEELLLGDARDQYATLASAILHLLQAGGKRLRPSLVVLVGRAIQGSVEPRHHQLAEAIELLHTATLIHDDIVDGSDVRRGLPTVNACFDNRISVLAGDFLLAKASKRIAQLDDTVISAHFAEVIMKMSEGEIQQIQCRFDPDIDLDFYLQKTERKTALLFAVSAFSSARLSGASEEVQQQFFQYGRHLGMAFQIADDLLDFAAPAADLGKPSGSDLAQGNLTAPVLFALKSSPQAAELRQLIKVQFNRQPDLERAMTLINQPAIIEQCQSLAYNEAAQARNCLANLAASEAQEQLVWLTDYVVGRRN